MKIKNRNTLFINRAFIALWTVLFLLFSSGLSVNIHYCGNKITSVKLIKAGPSCACGKKEDSCCKDKVKVFKTDNSFAKNTIISKLSTFQPLILPFTIFTSLGMREYHAAISPYFSPPELYGTSLYLRICRLSI